MSKAGGMKWGAGCGVCLCVRVCEVLWFEKASAQRRPECRPEGGEREGWVKIWEHCRPNRTRAKILGQTLSRNREEKCVSQRTRSGDTL